jgi:hypothetical protein
MATHNYTLNINSGVDTFVFTAAATDVAGKSVDETLALAASNVHVVIKLVRADIDSIVLSSVGGDCTIKTNSSGSPADTVVMSNGQILFWNTAAGLGADPFPTADVTDLYLSSTAGTVFKLRAVVTAANG